MINDDELAEVLPFVHDIHPTKNKKNKGQWGRDWWVVTPSGDEGQDFFTGRAMARTLAEKLGAQAQYVLRHVVEAIAAKGCYGGIEDGFLSEIGKMIGQKAGAA